jgi:hypothetical protein
MRGRILGSCGYAVVVHLVEAGGRRRPARSAESAPWDRIMNHGLNVESLGRLFAIEGEDERR